MLEVDGSKYEGGGQILRTALALSALTGTSFKLINIRKNRKQPGLRKQHLTCVLAVKELCNAVVSGDGLGSIELEFSPKKIKFKSLDIDIGTAGSITLLMQSLLPIIIFANKKIKIQVHGGTDTKHSMPIDYFMNVFMPHLRKYVDYEIILEKRGYYPKGDGKLFLKLKPKITFEGSALEFLDFLRKEDKPIELLNKGTLNLIKGKSHASKDLMKADVADRQAKQARYLLNNYPVKIDIEYVESLSTGSGITLWALFSESDELDFKNPVILGSDSLGEKGKVAEKVGEEAATRLIKQINSTFPVDEYLADQLLPYMALFGGKMKVPIITEHCKANMYVIEKFLGVKFRIKEDMISI